ncbi:hypothetical protein ACH4T9_05190 [Micromonospora sp. NPDC020750]|uniref:hypothetical protein n=1 Tax=unclassified Micromonospora TaxID=2617518 RepID=UPI0037A76FFD
MRDNLAVFGVDMKDDPERSGMAWSYIESDDEATALKLALVSSQCEVFLFNELAVNVAYARFNLRIKAGDLNEFMHGTEIFDSGMEGWEAAAREAFNAWRKGAAETVTVEGERISSWTTINANLILNRGGASGLSISLDNEGLHQEKLAVWLVDNLHPAGVVHSPQVEENGQYRELTDLLLAYPLGCFFVESKTLTIFGRPTLPDRRRLSRDIAKHVEKASKQLLGAVRSVRRGLPVLDEAGRQLPVSTDQPPHLIVLVPDLSLLAGADKYDSSFFAGIAEENEVFFHILDPVELLRVVQAAEMIADLGDGSTTKMMAFDFYLMERVKYSMNAQDPNFRVLFRG